MFDSLPTEAADLRGLSDADLAATIADGARMAAAAEAAKSTAIAELVRRRCVDAHPDWACDDWDACAAELACVLAVSQRDASGQMRFAITLRDRLPKVAALFRQGRVSARIVGTIAWRTQWVEGAAALDAVDTDIANAVTRWGRLSQQKIEKAVDAAVLRHDPAAVHRVRTGIRSRYFTVGDADDQTGTTSVWGKLADADAALLEEVIVALTNSVCRDDPRTQSQRRADALGALAVRATSLACRCGKPDCPADSGADPVAAHFVIHVLAEADAVDTPFDPQLDGGPDDDAPDPDDGPDSVRAPDRDDGAPDSHSDGPAPEQPESHRPRGIALIPGMPGTGLLDAVQVADLIARGARVGPLTAPDDAPAPGYRPTAMQARWIRLRDLTCRHPGCDQRAVGADIDHTVPWPDGPTHPSNNSCRCRKHHLVKTFWPGWLDRQDPDGQVHITTPSGITYTTKPTAALLFPQWNTTTATLATLPAPKTLRAADAAAPVRGRKMPKRKQTRAQARAQQVKAARSLDRPEVAPF